jgi:protein O-mannosyl-transferase
MPKRKRSSNKSILQDRPDGDISPALPRGLLAGSAIIIVSIFLAYYPCLQGGFIFDDDILLTDNHLIKASDGPYQFWFTVNAEEYYPVANTMFWIEWRIWGMNPTGYHVVNVIIHIADALLIWFILRKLSISGAFLAAMIFAVHPVNVESVAWIAQLRNVLAMLFLLLSIWCYLQSETQPRPKQRGYRPDVDIWYFLGLTAFMLGMLSKGSVAVLPIILLGIILWLRKIKEADASKLNKGVVGRKASEKNNFLYPLTEWDLLGIAPFVVAAVGFTAVNIWFQTHGTGQVIRSAGFVERLLGAGGVVWFYIYKAILPINLVFVYPQWHINAGNLLWWMPLMVTLAVTAVLWRYRKGWSRPFFFAWGFFCVALVPVMGFADVGYMKYSLVADHYQHIAIIGIISLVAAGWREWNQRPRGVKRGMATAVAFVTVGALTLLTWQQSGIYRDAITLYEYTLKKNPECWMAQNNLGKALLNTNKKQEAIYHFQKAIHLKSDYPEAHYNLGIELAKTGRIQEAIEQYETAAKYKPEMFEAYNNLGAVLFQQGRPLDAIKYYKQSLQINPEIPEAQNNLGLALIQTGQPMEAIGHCEQAIRLRPDYLNAYNTLIFAYVRTDQPTKAIATARKALDVARSTRQTAQVKQIEDWLKLHGDNLSK